MTNDSIEALVAQLPEIYQPIYGHPELANKVSRSCNDRLQTIRPVLEDIARLYGRPLRLLDLGCAQGYFTLSLADLCEVARGIDLLPENIAVCDVLRNSARLSNVEFVQCDITRAIETIKPGDYDIVLGLSVFHHICHSLGLDRARALIGDLAQKVDVLIVELAEKAEPLYWADSLPEDSTALLGDVPFLRTLGYFPTHLSEIERRLCYVSARVWHFPGSTERFETWTDTSHEYEAGANQKTRRYFFSASSVAKVVLLYGPRREVNIRELKSEVGFLTVESKKLNGVIRVPALRVFDIGNDIGYIVTERLPGTRLSTLIENQEKFASIHVIESVLRQLVELESAGLYHDDVRVWNVLLDDEQRCYLLDFGSIRRERHDVVWPFDPLASFLLFVAEVAAGRAPRVTPFRAPSLSPAWLKAPLRGWAEAVWALPHTEWTFELFLRLLEARVLRSENRGAEAVTHLHPANIVLWMGLTERLMALATEALPYEHMKSRALAAESQAEERRSRLDRANDLLAARDTEMQFLHGHIAALDQGWNATRGELAQARELLAVRDIELAQARELLAVRDIELAQARELLAARDGEIQRLNAHIARQQEGLTCATEDLSKSETALAAVFSSTSWRVTAPMRWAKRLFIGRGSQEASGDSSGKHPLNPLALWLLGHERIASYLRRAIRQSSLATNVARRIVYGPIQEPQPGPVGTAPSGQALPQLEFAASHFGALTVDEILARVRAEIAQQKKDGA